MNAAAETVDAAAERGRSNFWIWIALATVYIVWGSTYLAIKVVLESYPPFLMAAVRFLCAGTLLFAWLRVRGTPLPSARQWRNCAVTGTLLLAGGNGLVCYAEQTVTSSLAAVAVAGMPLFAALFAGWYGRWPHGRDWIGLAIGFAGVILLNVGGDMRASPAGAIALIAAPLLWAVGSVWSKHQDMPGPWMSTAAQMLTGGVALTVITLLTGESLPHAPTLRSTAALVYLVLFGSIAAFTAYVFLLDKVRPALATSYAYVNPPIAVLFGVGLAAEHVATLDVVSMIVILTGVGVILAAKR